MHHRNTISYIKEDAYGVLVSLLDTEVTKQALSILAVLSAHEHCHYRIAASGGLVPILNILENDQVHEMSRISLDYIEQYEYKLLYQLFHHAFRVDSQTNPTSGKSLSGKILSRHIDELVWR